MESADGEYTIGAALSLSGGNVRQARMAAAGLVQAVEDVRRAGGVTVDGQGLLPRLALLDDGGTGKGLHRALDLLAGADLLIGPYGSGLAGEAGRWAAERGRVVWNHGGSADEVEMLPRLVSVASPTSRYLADVIGVVSSGVPGGRVLIGAGAGSFGRAAADGAIEAATELRMASVDVVAPHEVPESVDADVLLLAGSFDEDVAVVRRLRVRPRVVAAVAGGLREFAEAVGARRADGVVAPSQWEEGAARLRPDVGPRSVDVLRNLRFRLAPDLAPGTAGAHVEYPAAQAYAAVLIAQRCVADTGGFDDEALLAAAHTLRCTTFFGRFGLAPDGRQADHSLVVVQWQNGVKCVVGPPGVAEQTMAFGSRNADSGP
jgi:branched-chain amino acid transport system substrate-binding protein